MEAWWLLELRFTELKAPVTARVTEKRKLLREHWRFPKKESSDCSTEHRPIHIEGKYLTLRNKIKELEETVSIAHTGPEEVPGLNS